MSTRNDVPDAEPDGTDAEIGAPDGEIGAPDGANGVPDGETANAADPESGLASQAPDASTPDTGTSIGSTQEVGRESRGVGIWALLFGIASVFCCFPAGIIAIVLGVRGRRRTVGNTTMATLGLLLGVIGLLGTAVAFGYYSGVLG